MAADNGPDGVEHFTYLHHRKSATHLRHNSYIAISISFFRSRTKIATHCILH
jgi:hypothetical protein